jgi:trehalose-phosphatase
VRRATPTGDESLVARLRESPLVIMLDVDGTLAPIAERFDEAVVPVTTQRVVAALTACDGVRVVLVSGRAARVARHMVSVANVWAIGNHGFEVMGPDGEERSPAGAVDQRPAVAQAARRLEPLLSPVPGVILEDKSWTLSVHYRLADPAVFPQLRSTIEEVIAPLGLRVTEGKKVLELRPAARVDKGTAVLALGKELGGLPSSGAGALVYIGDDVTDEDAFRALRARAVHAVTIRVTHNEPAITAAEYTLTDPDAVRRFLEWVLAVRE